MLALLLQLAELGRCRDQLDAQGNDAFVAIVERYIKILEAQIYHDEDLPGPPEPPVRPKTPK